MLRRHEPACALGTKIRFTEPSFLCLRELFSNRKPPRWMVGYSKVSNHYVKLDKIWVVCYILSSTLVTEGGTSLSQQTVNNFSSHVHAWQWDEARTVPADCRHCMVVYRALRFLARFLLHLHWLWSYCCDMPMAPRMRIKPRHCRECGERGEHLVEVLMLECPRCGKTREAPATR